MDDKTLLDILPERLKSGLREAEKRLLKFAPTGEPLVLQENNKEFDRPENAKSWPPEREIRAELLQWLCTDKKASELVNHKGIQILGAKITGKLDLSFATIPFPLGLFSSHIEEDMSLIQTRIRALNLRGSHTGSISADGIATEGDIFLDNGFHAKDAVCLIGARVGGNLVCSNGTFENEKKEYALSADGIATEGSIFLDNGFKAKGAVRLVGAKVGGDLVCSNGTFENEKKEYALSADGIATEGDIFLDDGFKAKGEVRLLGAKVGGNLDCSKGTFENENGDPLCCQNMEVKQNLWLPKKKPVGLVDLSHAKTAVLVDAKTGWPDNGKLRLDGFEYGSFASDNTPKDAETRLKWLKLQPHECSGFFIFHREWDEYLKRRAFKPQPYEQLAKVLRAMGHERDARGVLIAKQEALRKSGELKGLRLFWNRVLGVTVGYGWKPERSLMWIGAVVFFGYVMFFCADKSNVMQPSKERVYMSKEFKDGKTIPDEYPRFNPLIYSIDAFVPFVDLHQENYWLPDASKPYGRLLRVYFWFHIALGWALSTIAALSLTNIIRKE